MHADSCCCNLASCISTLYAGHVRLVLYYALRGASHGVYVIVFLVIILSPFYLSFYVSGKHSKRTLVNVCNCTLELHFIYLINIFTYLLVVPTSASTPSTHVYEANAQMGTEGLPMRRQHYGTVFL